MDNHQLQNLQDVIDCILTAMKEQKKLHKYSDLPNARDLAQQIKYNCLYYLREDFGDLDAKEFPNEVGTYLFHKVFMEYCPFIYIKLYEENNLGFNSDSPFQQGEDYNQAVQNLRKTYAKDFSKASDKMVFVDLKRTVLGNLINEEEQYEEMLQAYGYILSNNQLKEKGTQKELIEMLELLEGIDEQTKSLKHRIEKLLLKKS